MYHLTPMAEFRPVRVIRYTTITARTRKPIKTSIYICISPYAHIPNLKLSSYSSGTTKEIRGGYASAKQNFMYPINQELLSLYITGLPLDVQMQRNRLDVDELMPQQVIQTVRPKQVKKNPNE
jgi:hypothetical protein